MKKILSFVFIAFWSVGSLFAQNSPRLPPPQNLNLTEYGVRIQPDARLIVMMAALDVAGFDTKQKPDGFRLQLREDLKNLDPNLRERLKNYFQRNNRNLTDATPSEQIARYVSLAYALTPAPELAAPERSLDLPPGILEIFDFAALIQEFYRKSVIAEKLPEYTRSFQAFGDNKLRPPTALMIRDLTLYLNTRPQTVYIERVSVKSPTTENQKGKKPAAERVERRTRERHFWIVPDLLAVPNSVKLRVVGDDYYAIVGEAVDARDSSELRRAYLQFLADALVFKGVKEISVQRDGIKQILTAVKSGATISPDVFLTVSRSFVVAADVRQTEAQKIKTATDEARRRIDVVKTEPEKRAVSSELKKTQTAIEAETFAELAEAVESGAVLSFYFADRLRGLESSGFDVADSFAEMIAALDTSRELTRLKESASQRAQAVADLKKRRETSAQTIIVEDDASAIIRRDALVSGLNDVEKMLATKDYETAESRLKELLTENKGEPRILYAMGRTASLSARDVFDENLRDERLRKAAAYYGVAIQLFNSETPPALRSLTHVALAQIFEFYENNAQALKQFEAAVAIGDVKEGAYQDALAGKQRLAGK